MNVTAVGAAAGWVAVNPCGVASEVSNLNMIDLNPVPNAVAVGLTSGAVCVLSNVAVDVVLDVTGWYGPGAPLRLQALPAPLRVYDTREAGIGRRAGGSTTRCRSGPGRDAGRQHQPHRGHTARKWVRHSMGLHTDQAVHVGTQPGRRPDTTEPRGRAVGRRRNAVSVHTGAGRSGDRSAWCVGTSRWRAVDHRSGARRRYTRQVWWPTLGCRKHARRGFRFARRSGRRDRGAVERDRRRRGRAWLRRRSGPARRRVRLPATSTHSVHRRHRTRSPSV